jgi:hypothetical protein
VPQRQSDADQPLLRAVVQIPLDAASLLMAGGDDAGAGGLELILTVTQVGQRQQSLSSPPSACATGYRGPCGERDRRWKHRNRRRRHSTIGYDIPVEYEHKHALTRATSRVTGVFRIGNTPNRRPRSSSTMTVL